MKYIEKWLKDNNGTILDFKQAQEDLDGFCPSDIEMDSCSGMKYCSDCWNREIKENETE